jgi:hypothetical protein
MSKPRTRRALPNQRSVTLARRAKLERQYAYRDKLPFVARNKSGGEFWWNVAPSGEYEDDYQTGKAYAVAFWSICGGRPTCGIDLGQILFAMHERPRPRTKAYRRHNGLAGSLSGIEIGFIRTIGDIVDMTVRVPVIVGLGPQGFKRLAKGKKPLSSRETSVRVRMAAKLTGILIDSKQEWNRKQAAARTVRCSINRHAAHDPNVEGDAD